MAVIIIIVIISIPHILRVHRWKKQYYHLITKYAHGRAHCRTCDKSISGSIYRIANDKSYYCLKHALDEAKKMDVAQAQIKTVVDSLQDEQVEVTTTQKNQFKGKCEYCHGTVKSYLDGFLCPYCKKWHCSKHRLPEKHGCANPKKPRGMKSSPVRYRRK